MDASYTSLNDRMLAMEQQMAAADATAKTPSKRGGKKKPHAIPVDTTEMTPRKPPPGGFPLTVKHKTPCKHCAKSWQLKGTLCSSHSK
jgi:hypothetical protein